MRRLHHQLGSSHLILFILSGLIGLLWMTGTVVFFFFSSRRRHTRFDCDWSSDVALPISWSARDLGVAGDSLCEVPAADGPEDHPQDDDCRERAEGCCLEEGPGDSPVGLHVVGLAEPTIDQPGPQQR